MTHKHEWVSLHFHLRSQQQVIIQLSSYCSSCNPIARKQECPKAIPLRNDSPSEGCHQCPSSFSAFNWKSSAQQLLERAPWENLVSKAICWIAIGQQSLTANQSGTGKARYCGKILPFSYNVMNGDGSQLANLSLFLSFLSLVPFSTPNLNVFLRKYSFLSALYFYFK